MALTKTTEEIEKLRQGGALLSQALKAAVVGVRPGVNIRDLDAAAEKVIIDGGWTPSFKGYKSTPQEDSFPSTTCISINEEIVHGVGNRDIELKEGDIVSIDIGCWYEGLCTDISATVPVGKVSKEAEDLIRATKEALMKGVEAAVVGNEIKDISREIERHGKANGYGVVRALVGHGVGHRVHEPPHIPNFVDEKQSKIEIQNGMVLALEPMFGLGDYHVETAKDGWSVKMADGKISAHFEVSIACTEKGTEILTPLPV